MHINRLCEVNRENPHQISKNVSFTTFCVRKLNRQQQKKLLNEEQKKMEINEIMTCLRRSNVIVCGGHE